MGGNADKGVSLFAAWEKRDYDALVAYMADNVSFSDRPRGVTMGAKDEIKGWFASWAEACPDSTASARVICESPDTVVIEGLYEGTNSGPFGPLPATGRTVSVPFINVLQFDAGGRISSGSAYYDQLTLMIQLGHMEPPGG